MTQAMQPDTIPREFPNIQIRRLSESAVGLTISGIEYGLTDGDAGALRLGLEALDQTHSKDPCMMGAGCDV